MNTRKCKRCLEEKPHFRGKKLIKGYQYIDDKNTAWSGLYCPECAAFNNRRRHGHQYGERIRIKITGNEATCHKCGITKPRIKNKESKNPHSYKDDRNKSWNGVVCPDCTLLMNRKRKGNVSIDEIQNPMRKLARECEWEVYHYFKNNGYDVEINSHLGPDLVLKKNGFRETCEVKMISSNKKNPPTSYRVSSVKPNRKNDNLIAYVMPKKFIIFEKMEKHLSLCQRNGGARTITHLCRPYLEFFNIIESGEIL